MKDISGKIGNFTQEKNNMKERFFLPANNVNGITDDDYRRVWNYIHALNSLSQIAYGSIYVIDFFRKRFLYVSSNPLLLCGHTPEEILEMGADFYLRHIPQEELEYILNVAERLHRFLINCPKDERTLFSISYDVHLVNNGDRILINHRLAPLELDREGNIWLGVCYLSLSNNDVMGNFEIRRNGQSEYWRYDNNLDRWTAMPGIRLTKGEKEVLFMSARGMTIDEIAKNVCRSTDTIKSRRKAIFDKLNVRNMNEAITFATNYKLI